MAILVYGLHGLFVRISVHCCSMRVCLGKSFANDLEKRVGIPLLTETQYVDSIQSIAASGHVARSSM